MELFYDILNSINNASGNKTPTGIQQNCNISYDKFSKYVKELNQKGLIDIEHFSITEKGKKLLDDYDKIKDFLIKMKMEYVYQEETLENAQS